MRSAAFAVRRVRLQTVISRTTARFPRFGLPELFAELGTLLGRAVPESEREARTVLGFYCTHGPLPREPFLAACARTAQSLGTGRALAAYLADLQRQIGAQDVHPDPQQSNDP
jgi:hypothetical protein